MKSTLAHRLRLVSKVFQPSYVLPKGMRMEGITCKSQRLMLANGLIRPTGPGTFHLLPLAQRALDKLIRLIDSEMAQVGGQKITMPCLTSAAPWKESGRWNLMEAELLKLNDRHGAEMCLAPTHEEAVTEIIAAEGLLSYKQLPIKLYQVTTKFRDERRPRFGLLRGREFLMKDMYSFDSSEEEAKCTYHTICDAYLSLFRRLQLDCVKVVGDTGSIGGSLSHEYHLLADTGEDDLFYCDQCGHGVNAETTDGKKPACTEKCTKECPLSARKGIEVGHAFLLGTKYSKVFGADFIGVAGNKQLTEMGCYGLGVTRILAASVEVLSLEDEIRWPSIIAPFQIYVVLPKRKSKEEAAIPLAEMLCNDLLQYSPSLQDELLLDDRDHLTIGRKVKEAKKIGFPYIIVVGKKALEDKPLYELHDTNQDSTVYLTRDDLFNALRSFSII